LGSSSPSENCGIGKKQGGHPRAALRYYSRKAREKDEGGDTGGASLKKRPWLALGGFRFYAGLKRGELEEQCRAARKRGRLPEVSSLLRKKLSTNLCLSKIV